MVEGLGLLRASTLLLPEQIIYDDEIYRTNRILTEGIDTSADKLALDVIETVGPGGHFLAQKHTRRTIRDIWIPELTHPAPTMSGQPSPDIRERARETFKKILMLLVLLLAFPLSLPFRRVISYMMELLRLFLRRKAFLNSVLLRTLFLEILLLGTLLLTTEQDLL